MRKATSFGISNIKKIGRINKLSVLSQQTRSSSDHLEKLEKENDANMNFRNKVEELLKMDNFSKSPKYKALLGEIKTKEDFVRLLKQTSIASSKVQYEGHNVENLIKKPAVRVAVTGAAGNIGYSLLFRIASGEMLGRDQPVILHLLEIPQALSTVKGVAMELNDCAFNLLEGIEVTSDFNEGFKNVDYALLVGAKPRGKGMERKDLLLENAKIFQQQGKALNDNAKKSVKVLVVGNPANTNALIASANAKNIPPENFSAMTRLDQDRAMAQISLKKNVDLEAVDKVIIWGNHSATQYPDVSNTTINGKNLTGLSQKYLTEEFIPTVQQRGAAIIKARGASSAASAADAAVKHMRDWALGSDGKWVSMAVPSDGSYGVKKGLYTSYPVICTGDGNYEIVKNLKLDTFSKQKIKLSIQELEEEKAAVKALLK